MREQLIAAGIRNLKEYGYPAVSAENILTDQIYGAFFKGMLEDNLGKSDTADEAIKALIAELAK
jgi:hypothetical protein